MPFYSTSHQGSLDCYGLVCSRLYKGRGLPNAGASGKGSDTANSRSPQRCDPPLTIQQNTQVSDANCEDIALQPDTGGELKPFAAWAAHRLIGQDLLKVAWHPFKCLSLHALALLWGSILSCTSKSASLVQESGHSECTVVSQLKRICGLYLQSDVQKLQHAVSRSNLTDLFIEFFTQHYRASTVCKLLPGVLQVCMCPSDIEAPSQICSTQPKPTNVKSICKGCNINRPA